jgi:uncharacterized protein
MCSNSRLVRIIAARRHVGRLPVASAEGKKLESLWGISDDLIAVPHGGGGIIADGRRATPILIDSAFHEFLDCLKALRQVGPLSFEEIASVVPPELLTHLNEAGIAYPLSSPLSGQDEKKSDFVHSFNAKSDTLTTFLTLNQYCNLKCVYCLEGSETYRISESLRMSEETAREAVKFMSDHLAFGGRHGISLFGGEPLLSWDLGKRIIEFCLSGMKRIRPDISFDFSMQTNLTFLPRDFCEYAKKHAIRIVANIDGPEDIHNRLRPARGSMNSYASTVRCLQELSSAGVDFELRTTITSLNVNMLTEIEQLHKSLGATRSVFALLRPVNSDALVFDNSLFASPASYRLALEKLLDTSNDVGNPLRREYGYRLAHYNTMKQACHASSLGVPTVDVNGDLYTCSWFVGNPSLKVGSVRDKVVNVEALAIVADAMEIDEWSDCHECAYRHKCAGGCAVTRVVSDLAKVQFVTPTSSPAEHYAREMQCAVTKSVVDRLLLETAGLCRPPPVTSDLGFVS